MWGRSSSCPPLPWRTRLLCAAWRDFFLLLYNTYLLTGLLFFSKHVRLFISKKNVSRIFYKYKIFFLCRLTISEKVWWEQKLKWIIYCNYQIKLTAKFKEVWWYLLCTAKRKVVIFVISLLLHVCTRMENTCKVRPIKTYFFDNYLYNNKENIVLPDCDDNTLFC